MQTVQVKVKPDHLDDISAAKSPLSAVSELIWNALDADADRVDIVLRENPIGGLEQLVVTDNGRGLPLKDAATAFESLGGSWKRESQFTSQAGRRLHGKRGRGRFLAFSLGSTLRWRFRYQSNGKVMRYDVDSRRDTKGTFRISDESPQDEPIGVTVTISDIQESMPSLYGEKALSRLTQEYALYLLQYPDVRIAYDGTVLDPKTIQLTSTEYALHGIQLADNEIVNAELTIIEWRSEQERSLLLCDEDGFSLFDMKAGIQARGFFFTAYLKCDLFRAMDRENRLLLGESDQHLAKILKAARGHMREHFRKKQALHASDLVAEWKRDKIYPYEAEAADLLEETERQVFDICACNINDFLPEFEESSLQTKKFTLHILKQALEQDPTHLHEILQNVLDLPDEKKEELAGLLKKTTLSAVIDASRIVAERLEFINGLESLVYEDATKGILLERKQLHKLLADNTWVFGEAYNLWGNDEALTTVVRKHHLDMGIDASCADDPIQIEDQSKGIVDLWLSRVQKTSDGGRHHLVIELKRPTEKIGLEESTQIKRYAFALMADERFCRQQASWVFMVVSNEITSQAQLESTQADKPIGLLWSGSAPRCQIWVRSWSEIIEDCKTRLSFYQETLCYEATRGSGLDFLKKTYSKYVPAPVAVSTEGSQPKS